MAKLSEADMIWNRACLDPLRALPGDRALADMIRAHGLVMNGGVLHAVELLTESERSDAETGYRYFGFDGVSLLLSRARAIFEADDDLGNHEQRLDREYSAIISSGDALAMRFEESMTSNPSDYAPLRAQDMK